MTRSARFTDHLVTETGIRARFETDHRWQRWLDVEAALAIVEAELGIVPVEASEAIAKAARLSQLDMARIERGLVETSHPLMPLITELSRVVGEPHGEWVHWGATTQNITQTGDVLVLRDVHDILLSLLANVLDAAAELAERNAETVMAGRTHGQHAVPMTFGFKVAVWIDEITRHVARLSLARQHLFVAMMGGAIGTYASFGAIGPEVQRRLARRLKLQPMTVPARSVADMFAEYVCVLAILAGTGGKIGKEIHALARTEVGEADEPAPPGAVGSSTMPHKRNPKLSADLVAISAEIRAMAPMALEAMGHEHEVDGALTASMHEAVSRTCVLTGDLLARLDVLLTGLETAPRRMRANLDLTEGLITSEAVMLALGQALGRQRAHEIVQDVARSAAISGFAAALAADERVSEHLNGEAIRALLDPSRHVGLSAEIARSAAVRARALAGELRLKEGDGAHE
jgi:3-carboxy-cis,cis-muconate cycloisomerase